VREPPLELRQTNLIAMLPSAPQIHASGVDRNLTDIKAEPHRRPQPRKDGGSPVGDAKVTGGRRQSFAIDTSKRRNTP
jgi:hypothetical protein